MQLLEFNLVMFCRFKMNNLPQFQLAVFLFYNHTITIDLFSLLVSKCNIINVSYLAYSYRSQQLIIVVIIQPTFYNSTILCNCAVIIVIHLFIHIVYIFFPFYICALLCVCRNVETYNSTNARLETVIVGQNKFFVLAHISFSQNMNVFECQLIVCSFQWSSIKHVAHIWLQS